MALIDDAHKAADLVRDAGGRIIGRTRLQKIAFILEAAGLGSGFSFRYKHYGPYSEELADAAGIAQVLDLIQETEQPASWGGTYSIYTTQAQPDQTVAPARIRIFEQTTSADAVELELAATALFLAKEGVPDAWNETIRRKPEKARGGRIDRAKSLYESLRQIPTPSHLPQF